MKKLILLYTFMLFLAIGVTGCGRSNDDTPPSVVNFGILQMPNDLNLARALGFFDDLDFDVNFFIFEAGRDINLAMASGSIDFGLLGSVPASIAISSEIGVDIYWIHGIYSDVEALVVRTETNIRSFDDLHGAVLAVTFGSTSHYSLLNALELNNVSLSDITLLDMPPPDIYAAWQRGDIDGAFVWMPTLSRLLNTGGHALITAGELAELGIVTANVGYVRREFGQRHPEIVAEIVNVLMRTHDIYNENHSFAAQTLAEMFDLSEDEAMEQMDSKIWVSAEEQLLSEHLGGGLANILKDTADFFHVFGSIENYPALSLFTVAVNPSFIEAALNE